ncbi:type II toxin-antitoxin system RelE/ParE family toxin [Thermodesulfobacteriota bacterium]
MAKKYSLLLAPAAKRDLKKMPLHIQDQMVFQHLPEIERDPLGVGKPLFGALKGELSYHFGRKPEYRIIYFIENDLATRKSALRCFAFGKPAPS